MDLETASNEVSLYGEEFFLPGTLSVIRCKVDALLYIAAVTE